MKKIIAILLTVAMAFSFASIAFAEDKVTIPLSTAATMQYDTNYLGANGETKWYSVKAVSKYLMLTSAGEIGKSITLNVYKADGTEVKVDTKGGNTGDSFWSLALVYIVTVGETYYVKATFNGAYFIASNCWLDYSKYNTYSNTTLDNFKLIKSDVTQTISGFSNTRWDVYEVAEDYIWEEEYLDENVGCYFTSVKVASNTPVYFENKCSTQNVPSIYKGLYTEEGYVGSELSKNEHSYFAVSYDVLNSDKYVYNTSSRASVLVYVEADSKVTEKNGVLHISKIKVDVNTSGWAEIFVNLVLWFHSFLPLIESHIASFVNFILGLF